MGIWLIRLYADKVIVVGLAVKLAIWDQYSVLELYRVDEDSLVSLSSFSNLLEFLTTGSHFIYFL